VHTKLRFTDIAESVYSAFCAVANKRNQFPASGKESDSGGSYPLAVTIPGPLQLHSCHELLRFLHAQSVVLRWGFCGRCNCLPWLKKKKFYFEGLAGDWFEVTGLRPIGGLLRNLTRSAQGDQGHQSRLSQSAARSSNARRKDLVSGLNSIRVPLG